MSPTKKKFAIGQHIRVRKGVADPDFPDIPLGGWSGVISETDKESLYLIRWSQHTLQNMHPVYRKRCERDGLEFEEMWLGEDDLETNSGEPVNIEQPKEIRTKPLLEKDQDDRIRMIFDLTSDDPLPDVDDETLLSYHAFLREKLTFPFEAKYGQETGAFSSQIHFVKVMNLGDADDDGWIDDHYGLLCEAKLGRRSITIPLGKIEVTKRQPNRQEIEDYCYWIWNYG